MAATVPRAAGGSGTAVAQLPPLRQDLTLHPGPADDDGAPTWTIHDPVNNRFFRIHLRAFELLSRWRSEAADGFLRRVQRESGLRISPKELEGFVHFLRGNALLQWQGREEVMVWSRRVVDNRGAWLKRLLLHYLFFRIPLLHPDRFLTASRFLAAPFFSPALHRFLAVIGLLGLFFTLRQWDRFQNTFVDFLSWEGALYFAVTLMVVKVFHELGHAYTANRHGCRVSTMGIAFLVLVPVLYTDASDAWKLPSKQKRMAISGAGMMVEMGLAAVALFAWSILPEGPMRAAAFLVATTTWIMTLTINLNPFLRFDGYYLLSDGLGVENLHGRSFRMGRWWLREKLFAYGDPPPERLRPFLFGFLILFAWATWLFRLFLFLGIAWLVYSFFFKLLGLFLAIVEAGWFIVRPVWMEVAVYWKRRSEARFTRGSLIFLLVLAGLSWILLVPWRQVVPLPAVWQAADHALIFSPFPARIDRIHVQRGARVSRGEVLFSLSSPELESQLLLAEKRLDLLQLRLARRAASEEEGRKERVLRKSLASAEAHLEGLRVRKARLTITAPLTGRVTDLADILRPGLWIDGQTPLARVVDSGHSELLAFLPESESGRIDRRAVSHFYPDDPARPALAVRVVSVAEVNTALLDLPYLASVHGGEVAVRVDAQGRFQPVEALYRVTLEPVVDGVSAPARVVPGVVRLAAAPRSLADRLWRNLWAALLRESGF